MTPSPRAMTALLIMAAAAGILTAAVRLSFAAASSVPVMNAAAINFDSGWVIGALLLALFILMLKLLRRYRQNPMTDARPMVLRPPPAARDAHSAPSRTTRPQATPPTDTEQVLKFFQRLFKHQQNLAPDADAQLELIAQRRYCPQDTYEIRVGHHQQWASRRMSIGLLGQGGGSRSRCFYVIYDSHLVIKIPAEPVTDFQAYNRQIAAESRIVARLAPRLCIVPRVAVILKTIYALDNADLSEAEQERQYIELLETKPIYQEYLKLGGSFAFFMDLARYFFLSSTLEEIHGGRLRLHDEIQAHPELLWDPNGFAGRYGEQTGTVCHDLQNAFRQCELELQRLIDSAGIGADAPGYMFKQWFLTHLAGEKIAADHLNLDNRIIDQADRIIDQTLETHSQAVAGYRDGLGAYIRSVRFSRHHRQLENLAANTLELLAWIIDKGLALRDLKPENLFVAGNPNDYPIFLNQRTGFSIGLIDVETAVVLDGDDPDRFPQPQLAGTPLYATPTHLLSNQVLKTIYGDVRTTLQLQDWHATMAIVFKLICGENLFAATAHVFPEIVSHLKIMDYAPRLVEEQVKKISRLYWNSALAEFQEALHMHHAAINQVVVGIPPLLAGPLHESLSQGLADLEQAMTDLLTRQSFFSSPEKIQFLKTANAQKIGQMTARLIQARADTGRQGSERDDALQFFEQLEQLKQAQNRKQTALSELSSPHPAMAADQLLDAMFRKVFQHMYPSRWPALTPARYQVTADSSTDITTYQATL